MKEIIRSKLVLCFLLCGAFVSAITVNAGDINKPNLIVIMTEDLGYADVGFNGCEDIPKPNIDQIASDGVCIHEWIHILSDVWA